MCEQYKNLAKQGLREQLLSSADLVRQMIGFIGKGSGNGQ
jgi:hypothetical protein